MSLFLTAVDVEFLVFTSKALATGKFVSSSVEKKKHSLILRYIFNIDLNHFDLEIGPKGHLGNIPQ